MSRRLQRITIKTKKKYFKNALLDMLVKQDRIPNIFVVNNP